jgi:two-component system chemotaxis sensor kinase CheA
LSVDDDRFRQMFFEEARELLISLEEGLLELERRQGDRAHLDKTFRAAHSLKGAAGMVGLAALAEFTHGIEAVLERVRSGAMAIDAYVTTTLLEACDHLSAMVEGESGKSPIPASSELSERLVGLLREQKPAASASKPPEPAAPPPPAAEKLPPASEAPESPPPAKAPRERKPASNPAESAGKSKRRTSRSKKEKAAGTAPAPAPAGSSRYHITIKPGPDTLRRGVNPLGVLDELRDLGKCQVATDPNLVPPLDEIDPERCYLVWRIEVETDAAPERLDDVFLFIAVDSTVTVERETAEGDLTPLPPPPTIAVSPTPAPPPEPPAPAMAMPPVPPGGAPPRVPAPAAAGGPGPTGQRQVARIRVDAAQLDDLVGLAGELAVLSDNLQGLRELTGAQPWVHTLEALERVSRQIRDTTLDLRMVLVDELFSRFPRVVRDLADQTGKEVELRIMGQDTRLDRTIVERLANPMIHLIRNGVDHAIELPQDRVALGKPRMGRITLMAGHEGDRVTIRVSDDGKGLDRNRIVAKGIAVGLVPYGTSADDPRVDTLIFEPGFSTRDKVGQLSGRGVGLDEVRDAVRALRGSIAVESEPGKGTTFIFRLPLTLALIDGLLVETGGSRYVVPLAQVEECVALNGSKPALSKGRPCVAVRGELVPMVPLRKIFHADGEPPVRQELLLTRHAGQRVGVAVDRLLGRVQAVIQALGEGLGGVTRFSGATILGDGTVSLILDLAALVTESRAADNHAASYNGVRAEGF